jgi:hypothetical protein
LTLYLGLGALQLFEFELTSFLRRQQKDQQKSADGTYTATLEQIGSQIESVQDFWRYNNNTPVDQIKMRESIYLFKQGFQPVWEDRRNINGGSWTFRVPKVNGPDFWTRVQLMAIGEKLQGCLDVGKSYRVVQKIVKNTDKEFR